MHRLLLTLPTNYSINPPLMRRHTSTPFYADVTMGDMFLFEWWNIPVGIFGRDVMHARINIPCFPFIFPRFRAPSSLSIGKCVLPLNYFYCHFSHEMFGQLIHNRTFLELNAVRKVIKFSVTYWKKIAMKWRYLILYVLRTNITILSQR